MKIELNLATWEDWVLGIGMYVGEDDDGTFYQHIEIGIGYAFIHIRWARKGYKSR